MLTLCQGIAIKYSQLPWQLNTHNNIEITLLTKGNNVNKSELIDAIAASADLPKAAAGRALDATLEAVTAALTKGESVALVGFGTFTTKERAARDGRNPQTGATIKIAAATLPTFKPGKALKDAVNK